MSTILNKACILAAGLGSRLRPYTNDTPKPLVKVADRSLLDRTLDHLNAAHVNEIAINTHYLPEKINHAINARSEFKSHISFEPELLDTGGGIKNMLSHFNDAFFVLSGDGLWDGNALQQLREAWNPNAMDSLLLLQPVSSMTLTKGVGDYDLDSGGLPIRSHNQTGQYMFTSIRINHPRIFESTPNTAFSYLELMDKAQSQGRLHAIIHDGDWHHISTPQDLEAVDKAYRDVRK